MAESVMKDIGVYKQRLLSLILNSEDFCELMLGKDYTEDDVDALVYSQVFPYLYVDDTQTEVKSYLCFDFNINRLSSGTIKNMQLIIWAYCHKDCMRYSKKGYLGTRSDILSDIVERQLHNYKNIGIGKLLLISAKHFFPNAKYYGRELIFDISDFYVKEVKDT